MSSAYDLINRLAFGMVFLYLFSVMLFFLPVALPIALIDREFAMKYCSKLARLYFAIFEVLIQGDMP